MKPDLEKVLVKVNQARKKMDKPLLEHLPKGFTDHTSLCPLAQALDGIVFKSIIEFREEPPNLWNTKVSESVNFTGRSWIVGLPVVLQQFIRSFDAHQFPELEDDDVNL